MRRRSLRISLTWDAEYWLASDSVWAYATGHTPEAAVIACLNEARDFLEDCGDGSTLAGPAAEQYRTYRAFFSQAAKHKIPAAHGSSDGD